MEDLKIRAALDTAGVTKGVQEAIRATARLQASIKQQMAAAGVSAGSDIGRGIARSIDQAGATTIAKAMEKALVDGVRNAAGAVSRATAEMMQTVGQRLQSVGRTLSFAVTAPILALGGVTIKAAADLQKLRLGLVAITGSSEEAGAQLARLEQIAKLPGIGFEEALKGSQSLQAVGFSAAVAERSLKAFANTIALTGGGRAELERVTVQLAQMASAGKILTQDLRPLIQTAPALGMALKSAFGTVNAAEIEALGLSVEDFFDRLLTAQEALARAPGGVANSFDNLADSLKRANAVIGDAMLPLVVETVDKFSTWLETVRGMDTGIINLAISLAAALAVIGPLTLAVGTLAVAVAALKLAAGGLITLLVGVGIVALGAFVGWLVKNKLEASQAAGAVDEYAKSIAALSREQLILATANNELRITALEKFPQTEFIRGLIDEANKVSLRLATQFNSLPPTDPVPAAPNGLAVEAARLKAAQDALDAEMKARTALSDQIGLLNDARALGIDRVSTLQELIRLEGQLSAEIKSGTGSLDRRVFISQQLAKIPTFEPNPASLAIQQVGVSIGAVVIENAAEAQRLYREAVAATLAQAKIDATMNLKLVTVSSTPQSRAIASLAGQGRGLLGTVQSAFNDLGATIAAKLTPAALAAAGAFAVFAPIVKGAGEVLRPAIERLIEPLVEVGRVIGNALLPVLKSIEPVMVQLGRLLTLLIQPMATLSPLLRNFTMWMKILEPILRGITVVLSYFQQALGEFVRFIGKMLNVLPGSPGNAFVRAGQEMIDAAKAARAPIVEAGEEASEAIRAFARTLDGARRERELGNELRGIELNPTQVISGLLNDLKNVFPALFERIFAGVNLTDTSAIRQAAVRFFETMSSLSGPALEAFLGGAPVDEVLGWLGVFGDSLNSVSKAARDTATSLLGVPEVFNFTLASLRAAGTREFLPQAGGPSRFGPDRDPRTPSQDNRTTVAAGAVVVTVTQDGDELLNKIATVVATGLERAATLGGKTLTASEIRVMLKPELVRAAQSGGAGARELALNFPG